MDFAARKSEVLAALAVSAPDNSPKGSLDAAIIPLVSAVNLHPAYFTTSSCSGRISILAHLPPSAAAAAVVSEGDDENAGGKASNNKKSRKKAGGGGWVFVSHEAANADQVAATIFAGHRGFEGGELVFRFEPFILAAECSDVASAQSLLSTAIASGFRESGITSMSKRIMVSIRCSIRLEVPLGQVGRILVTNEYIHYLVRISNEKMEANKRRTDHFLKAFRCMEYHDQGIFDQSTVDVENKEASILSKTSFQDNGCPLDHNQHSSLQVPRYGFDSAQIGGSNVCASIKENSSLILLHGQDGWNCDEEKSDLDSTSGLPRVTSGCFLVAMLITVGEPVEKLFLWGHSACALMSNNQMIIAVFGGFGGLGHHARRNYLLTLDPISGILKEIDTVLRPSSRLGHTASVSGNCIYVVGGRTGPIQILNDVWLFDIYKNNWFLLECSGSVFRPRHRHASVAVGSNIYVFGGLNGDMIYSCMNTLNTDTLEWSEIRIEGLWPCARHSHSLVSYGSLLFMFGGYDGRKALGDLYSFDVRTCRWRMEKTTGRAPYPRFSHSMFIYKDYLGIIGGCPVKWDFQELSLLSLNSHVWMHLTIKSVLKDLWIRSSASIIDDQLFIIGGGASCYAFGTKFNMPMTIDLHLIKFFDNFSKDKEGPLNKQSMGPEESTSFSFSSRKNSITGSPNLNIEDVHLNEDESCINSKVILQVQKQNAKFVKDMLKKMGWLDISRKVQTNQDGSHVFLPVNIDFIGFAKKNSTGSLNLFDMPDCYHALQSFSMEGLSVNMTSPSMAFSILFKCGVSLFVDDAICSRKVPKSPQKIMRELVCSLLREKKLSSKLLEQLPARWDHLGDIVVLPAASFRDPIWDSIKEDLWPVLAKSLCVKRLARQGRILPTGTRDSTLEILIGDNGWVCHHENGILYSFDATKCMFSFGNHSEKLRMAQLDCRDEVIVDLFAGIGYFVLPFLVKAKAKLVYACEWNPCAVAALKHNVDANFVADRCIILEGDNRLTAPKGVADRLCLGLLPSSECSWVTAVKALRTEGGTLHIHGNVNDSEEGSWIVYVCETIQGISKSEGLNWDVSIEHVERVKWYGPHIRHMVADVRCRQACI